MSDIFENYIVRVISEHGVGFGIFTFLAVIILLSLAKNYVEVLWIRFWYFLVKHGQMILRKPNNRDLSDHIIFAKFQNVINVRLSTINTVCPIRRQLFRRIITLRIQSHMSCFSDFVQTKWFKRLDPDVFKLRINELFQDIHNKWREGCEREGVPNWLLDVFTKRISEFSLRWADELNVLSNSTYLYYDNVDRMHQIFEMAYVHEWHNLSMLEGILDETNGKIKELVFQGVSCLDCPVCAHDFALQRKELGKYPLVVADDSPSKNDDDQVE